MTATCMDQIHRNGAPLVDYDYQGRFVQNRTLTTTSGKEIALSIGYDDHRRITSIANTLTDPATDLMSFSLGRDVLGNLTASDATGAGQLDVGYTYNVLNRLVTAAYDTGSESFDMDRLGNRNNYTDSRDGDAIEYGTNNPVNKYTTIEGIGVAYDAAGNLITDEQGVGYTYDADNRLVGIASSTMKLMWASGPASYRVSLTPSYAKLRSLKVSHSRVSLNGLLFCFLLGMGCAGYCESLGASEISDMTGRFFLA